MGPAEPLKPNEALHRAGGLLQRGWVVELTMVCLLLLGVLALAARWCSNGIDLRDEGFIAHCASRVAHGEVPNRDFVTLQAPLPTYVIAIWNWIWGPSFGHMRMLGVLIHGAMVLLTYAMARMVTSRTWAFAICLPAILVGLPRINFVPLAVWQGIFFSMLAAWLALRSVATGSHRTAFMAGIVTTLSMISRHDQGFYLTLSLLVLALTFRYVPGVPGQPRKRFPIGYWIAGIASAALLPGIYWIASGAVPDMWAQLVIFPLTRYGATSGIPMPSLDQDGPSGSLLAFILFRVTPALAIMSTLLIVLRSLRKGYGEPEAKGLFLIAFAGFFYLQVLTRSDLDHLVLTAPPMWVLLAWLHGYATRFFDKGEKMSTRSGPLQLAVSGSFSAMVLAYVVIAFHMLLHPLEDQRRPLHLDRAGLTVGEEKAAMVERVVGLLQEHATADEPVMVLPYHPAFYFLADRRNPTHWGYHWPGDQTTEELMQLVDQARKDPPAIAVVFDRDSTATYLGPVIHYLDSAYQVVDAAADPVVYLPRSPH